MAGISDISIKYNNVTYENVDYCEIEITGTVETASAGQYAIVRHATACENAYAMGTFEFSANETTRFVVNDVINIEGASSEFHPTTGEATDIYLEYGGAQIGSAYRFTVGNCGEEMDEMTLYAIVGGSLVLVGLVYTVLMSRE